MIGAAVVGHDALHRDANGLELVEGTRQKGSSGLFAFVGQNLGENQARVVVDADVGDPRSPRRGCAFGGCR